MASYDTSTLLQWGIIGAGRIAQTFATACQASRTSHLAAVATRGDIRPELQTAFPGAKIVSGYDALLSDPRIQAVYIATPHTEHACWAIRAAEAGKHVLCEKPLGLNQFEVMAIIDAAQRHRIALLEGYMYRMHPQISDAIDRIRSGTLGEVRLMQASFGFNKPFDASHRLYDPQLAGGGVMDVGGYPLSMARLVAGTALGHDFAEPQKIHAIAQFAPSQVDHWSSAVLEFSGGLHAQISTSIAAAQDNQVRIFGSLGQLTLESPWHGGDRTQGKCTAVLALAGQAAQRIEFDDSTSLYTREIDALAQAIASGQQEVAAPGMRWADSVGQAKALDQWRAAIGLHFPQEQLAGQLTPLSRRPVAHARLRTMPMRQLPGLDTPVSALALGQAGFKSVSQSMMMNDRYFECGGNFFDTAWQYVKGDADKMLGQWLVSRGVRSQCVLLGKGAHTPNCFPEVIGKQLHESLDRLHTDYLDVYMMHRDNPDIPVGEFIDALDEHYRAGRFHSLGMSNWSIERMQQAIDYGRKHQRVSPTMLSNNFSLAVMENPVWAGCISSRDAAWTHWLQTNGLALLAWSSQARGFFTDRAGPDKRSDKELVNA